MKLPLSGSQTVGPYYAIGLDSLCTTVVPAREGDAALVEGQLLDSNGAPIPDGFLELWQADGNGEYSNFPAASPAQSFGFARVKTGAQGDFRFETIKPGRVRYDATQEQAPHLVVLVYMRGLLRNLYTRMYFPDEPANESDPILQLAPAERRPTLIAERTQSGVLHWDIVMRDQPNSSRKETVFFAW